MDTSKEIIQCWSIHARAYTKKKDYRIAVEKTSTYRKTSSTRAVCHNVEYSMLKYLMPWNRVHMHPQSPIVNTKLSADNTNTVVDVTVDFSVIQ